MKEALDEIKSERDEKTTMINQIRAIQVRFLISERICFFLISLKIVVNAIILFS